MAGAIAVILVMMISAGRKGRGGITSDLPKI
jgi:hypothetical protein